VLNEVVDLLVSQLQAAALISSKVSPSSEAVAALVLVTPFPGGEPENAARTTGRRGWSRAIDRLAFGLRVKRMGGHGSAAGDWWSPALVDEGLWLRLGAVGR
jgi:hypothetical protein